MSFWRRRRFVALVVAVVAVGQLFLFYQLIVNSLLYQFNVADLGIEHALSSTLKFYVFGSLVAVYAMWRGWSKASDFLRAGTAVFLPIMVATATYSLHDAEAVSMGTESTVAASTYIEILKNMPVIYLMTIGYWLIMFRSPLAEWSGSSRHTYSKRPQGRGWIAWFLPRTQSLSPDFAIVRALRKEALETSFVSIILALNVAILTVVVLLATGISGRAASVFCIVIVIAAAASLGLRGYFLTLGRFDGLAECGLTVMALLMAGSWGSLALFSPDHADPRATQLLLALLTCGGLAMILMSSQRIYSIIAGSLSLFFPFVCELLIQRPDQWMINITACGISILVILGFGIAVNKEHYQKTRVRLALQNANVEIESKSEKLEQALLMADEATHRVKEEYRLRERLLWCVSHDLRQPVNALGLFLHQLTKAELPTQLSKIVYDCRNCARSANEIIESISQLAWHSGQIEARSDVEFDLGFLFNRLKVEFYPQAQAKGTALRVKSTSLRVVGDERLIERILRNFLSNAVRVTGRGGAVVVGARRHGIQIKVLCFDTGPGIAECEQSKIFKAFYQPREAAAGIPGTLGLGLSIAKELADLIDAELIMRSTRGRGSMFGIILPLANSQTTLMVDRSFLHEEAI